MAHQLSTARRTFAALALILGTIVVGGPVHAVDLLVPSVHPTIQGAIAAAADGDRVLVAPGTYTEQINFLGKAIEVVSEQGPAVTTIDAAFAGTVVLFMSNEGPASLLEGFTIKHGQAPMVGFNAEAGGILCVNSDPTIRGNNIEDNRAHWTGAGISCVDSNAWIEGNEIHQNHFICLIADAPCGDGGGIYISGGSPTILGNFIHDNLAPRSGGGIYVTGTVSASIDGNRVLSNSSGSGGGILAHDASLTVANNLIANNDANGFFSLTGHIPGIGGGIAARGTSTLDVVFCTIADNSALPGGDGGAILASAMTTVTMQNSIAWGNSAATNTELGGAITVDYSNVAGGAPGTGNLNADPLFASNLAADYYLSHITAGQAANSPCIDMADPASSIGGSTRTDGVLDAGIRDMGFHRGAGATLVHLVRGDCSGDGTTNIADAVFLLAHLFPMTPPPALACEDACDANDDGGLNLADAVALLNSLFGMSPAPLPAPQSCGPDGTGDTLTCVTYTPCP